MKILQKYFLALVPPVEIFDRVHGIKVQIREKFGIKYALKSPPHITLKMPFNFNEVKEELLVAKLIEHLKEQESFLVNMEGVGTFGNRVIFLNIKKSEELLQLQQKLKLFCKQELHLVDELSDRNFHPHMTVAFKDLKPGQFSEVLTLVNDYSFAAEFSPVNLVLLKRIEGSWVLHKKIPFGR